MKSKKNITTVVICIVLIAVLFGFIYDAVMTSVEKSTHPQTYLKQVTAASVKYGVPEYIIFSVIKTESGFDPTAKSSADAYGLMQLIPETYEDMSGFGFSESAALSVDNNINYGTKYLSILYKKYDNWDTVYAAYNAGPGNVDKWLKDSAYSSDGKTLYKIPFEETRNYVRKVSAATGIYLRLYYS